MDTAIEAIRTFNRFFTQHVGAINARFLDSDANLPEARLLFEIAQRQPVTASTLQACLDLDRGYLSRMIARFEERGWTLRDQIEGDARSRPIRLTAAGKEAFTQIDQRQRGAVAHDLDRLGPVEQGDLVQALTRARLLLDPDAAAELVIRPARVGEVSMVAARQSVLYDASHSWGRGLEVVEAETTAAFLRRFRPGEEQCWIADLGGVMAGAVFLTNEGDGVARLRLLHVEPFARRRGIGDALVRQCIDFARERGYSQVFLWTQAVLESARRIYARNGFVRTAAEVHHEFGEPVDGESWQLMLNNED
ncbi:MAG: helix-turn-helix domain-containing GNAT family N-acetyltransferase [Novosphingobium sp.]